METFLHDLRHSLRMFWKSRGFTAAAVAALALGIGANTAIFSVVDAVLLKPVPFPEPDRLVMFLNTSPEGSGPVASPAKFQHWREQTSVVEDVSAFRTGIVNLTGNAFPEQLRSGEVSADYFRLFGAPVIRGRTFTAQEDLPHGERVAVLSDAFWKRRFGGDPRIVGKTISLSGTPYVVIGIIGPGFDIREFGPAPDVFTAFQLDPNTKDQGHYFLAAGRLKPGVTLAQAEARIKLSAGEYRRKFPEALRPKDGFTIQPMREAVVSEVRSSLWILLGAVSFVLLIACANVANLLLARAVGRRREIAIRSAIGAGRGRIIRQLLTESVLLSLGGALAGLALGVYGIRALLALNTAGLPRVGEDGALVALDWRVLAFTVVVAVGTGLLFGLIPALHSSRLELSSVLKESSSRSGSGFRQNKTRTILVVSEIALAIILLVGAALLIRTSVALAAVKPGFDASHVLTMRMSLTGPQFLQSAGIARMRRDGTERLRALPGVVEAAATCCIPLEGGYGLPFLVVGRPLQQGPFHGGGGWLTISPTYFDVFKIPILRGRAFTERDDASGERVVIINQAMARQYWPKGDPLTDQIWIGKGIMSELATETPRKIVGIAGDVHDGGLNRNPQPVMYVPDAQVPDALNALNVRLTPIAWVVRTRGEPYTMSAAIQEQLRQVTGLPVSDIRSMDVVISRSTSRQRFNMWLMSIFGGTALLLAAIGIYGLMAYSVEQRTQEIGIRLALGAEVGEVQNMVVWQGMRLSLVGVLIGIGAAFGLSRLIASFLFGVKANDPLVFVAIPILLSAVALLAVWVPARRATRIDPVDALRYE
ncbi:MAG TPA: ABC transporter permease [Bryobacteraceae bacterium]|jgi:predicted permease|nr:ABC transporter permease [Bryobacteraceae bacterium]